MRVLALAVLLVAAAAARAAEWNPAAFAAENTLELRTTGAQEGEHWSTLWLAVVDGQMYVRLGSRATTRVEQSTTRPWLAVRIAGHEFAHVKGEPAPEHAAAVAAAMGEKYWSDIFIRHFSHPLTLRLVPEVPVPQSVR